MNQSPQINLSQPATSIPTCDDTETRTSHPPEFEQLSSELSQSNDLPRSGKEHFWRKLFSYSTNESRREIEDSCNVSAVYWKQMQMHRIQADHESGKLCDKASCEGDSCKSLRNAKYQILRAYEGQIYPCITQRWEMLDLKSYHGVAFNHFGEDTTFIFYDLPSRLPPWLKTLNIEFNRISDLSDFDLPKLEVLLAQGNKLTGLPENMPRLEVIDVRNCGIENMSEDVTTRWSSKCDIDMRGNPLRGEVVWRVLEESGHKGYKGPNFFFSKDDIERAHEYATTLSNNRGTTSHATISSVV